MSWFESQPMSRRRRAMDVLDHLIEEHRRTEQLLDELRAAVRSS